jgi:hypothetical protein
MQDLKLTNANGIQAFIGPLDWSYSLDTGLFDIVEEEFMLNQLLSKDGLTTYASSPLNPQYGSALGGMSSSNFSPVLMGGLVTNEIKRMIGLFQRVMATVSQASPNELIGSIKGILIQNPSGNPTQFVVTTTIITQADEQIVVAIPVGQSS